MTVASRDRQDILCGRCGDRQSDGLCSGSKTGRDGIHGGTMSRPNSTRTARAKRPTVQVGDPFVEKLLLEACLELMATTRSWPSRTWARPGLTSSSFEMAAKGGLRPHRRARQGADARGRHEPYELMLSESQERMLIVLKPGREEQRARSSRNGSSISR